MEMKNKKRLKKIPEIKTEKEEAEFWDTHDSTEYIDWDKAEILEVHPDVKSPRDLSPRCPHDGRVLLSRYRNLVVADGFATLNKVRELYCPRGDYTRLAPETERLVKRAEAALRRVQPKAEKIAA
jgi:hypothetical protein